MKNNNNDIVICQPKRSAIGKLKGTLSNLEAFQISGNIIKNILHTTNLNIKSIDHVVLGNVLAAGTGMNPAKQASIEAGLPEETIAYNVNQVCGSGLQSIIQSYNSIATGATNLIIAGGHESMSNAPHVINFRKNTHLGNSTFIDSLINDGLLFNKKIHMGLTVESLVKNMIFLEKSKMTMPSIHTRRLKLN